MAGKSQRAITKSCLSPRWSNSSPHSVKVF